MKKNKKGFTLVELMAVIIVLIIIILIAVNLIKNNVDKTMDNTVIANAGSYIKAVNGYVSTEGINNDELENIKLNLSLIKDSINVSGTKPNTGNFEIENFEVVKACLEYDGYKVDYKNNKFSKVKKGVCDENSIIKYTGEEYVYKIPFNGVYRLEAWGAQGGSYNKSIIGGYGAYAVGDIYLEAGDVLYFNVGGEGKINNTGTATGGYNGGGSTTETRSETYEGSGGGATSIATESGVLSSVNKSKVLLVAGGGGGASYYTGGSYFGSGGSGGAYIGVHGTRDRTDTYYGLGGTQGEGGFYGNRNTTGMGSYGQGGTNTSLSTYGSAGGGGGYYGGAISHHAGAGGGSSYIWNPKMYNKHITCYNCVTSGRNIPNVISNTNVSKNPVKDTSKQGEGAASITYISSQKEDIPEVDDTTYVYYDNGAEYGYLDVEYTNHGDSNRAQFKSDRVSLTSAGYQVLYTDTIDLSKYNTVIFKRTGMHMTRTAFAPRPDKVNDNGGSYVPTYTALDADAGIYAGDISAQNRNDLKFYFDEYGGDGAGDIFYIAFSKKTVSELQTDHSFVH